MSTNWYYVQDNERIGPVEEDELKNLFDTDVLLGESFVWKKGFENWKNLKEIEELKYFFEDNIPQVTETEDVQLSEIIDQDIPLEEIISDESSDVVDEGDTGHEIIKPEIINEEKLEHIDWNDMDYDQRKFSIKIGIDRNRAEAEYGPFSLNMIKQMYEEKRVNAKTLIFTPGMDDWIFLADLEIFGKLFSDVPPVIEESERRQASRKPFVARLLFHDNSKVYEGICRDISVGGLQVLVADSPVNVGEEISMNVHPDNSNYSFVAKGKIVRVLDAGQGFSVRFMNLEMEAQKSIDSAIET